MSQKRRPPLKSYQNEKFLSSRHARSLRILSEYLEPQSRFERYKVDDTVVFMGSARIISRAQAEKELKAAKESGDNIKKAQLRLEMSEYYEAARVLARRLTEWSKGLNDEEQRFVVCTGGGPGIMEAANRGASEAKGINVGLTISTPLEEFDNRYITRELSFYFHYFFMRKFWFAYLAKAIIIFPGGFGTLDELFELLTLLQTRKIRKHLRIVLFGKEYWNEVINFKALVKYGNINPGDIDLIHQMDSVDEAYEFLVDQLTRYAIEERGAIL